MTPPQFDLVGQGRIQEDGGIHPHQQTLNSSLLSARSGETNTITAGLLRALAAAQ